MRAAHCASIIKFFTEQRKLDLQLQKLLPLNSADAVEAFLEAVFTVIPSSNYYPEGNLTRQPVVGPIESANSLHFERPSPSGATIELLNAFTTNSEKKESFFQTLNQGVQSFLNNHTNNDPVKAGQVALKHRRTAASSQVAANQVDHLDVSPARSVMTFLSGNLPTANHWTNIDPSHAVVVRNISNRIRGNTFHVLLPKKEQMIGLCGTLCAMTHEYIHSLKDDNFLATLVLGYQPYKYGIYNIKKIEKCQDLANDAGIQFHQIDRTTEEIEKSIKYRVQAYYFQLETDYKPSIEALELKTTSQWPYFQTLKRFELLSGVLVGKLIFDPTIFKSLQDTDAIAELKLGLLRCVQQVNTLKKLLELQYKGEDFVAFKTLEKCFQRCFVQVLKKHFNPQWHTSKLRDSFESDTAFRAWYENLFEDTSLLSEVQGRYLNLQLLEKTLLELNQSCQLFKRGDVILYGKTK